MKHVKKVRHITSDKGQMFKKVLERYENIKK
jgi:hypothetical protein